MYKMEGLFTSSSNTLGHRVCVDYVYVCIHNTHCMYSVLCCVVLFAGVPVTPSNVMRAVREVEDWWGEDGLGRYLSIPQSKREEIRQKFSDELEQKQQLISYWINTDPFASWRRLIDALELIKEAEVAASLRSNAEPLTGIIDYHSEL